VANLEFVVPHQPFFEHLFISGLGSFRACEVIRKISTDELESCTSGDFLCGFIDIHYPPISANGYKRIEARLNKTPIVCVCQPNFLFSSLAISNIDTHLQNERGTVSICKGKIVDIVNMTVRAGPQPSLRFNGLEGFVGFTAFTGACAPEEMMKTLPVLRIPKKLPKNAIGEWHPVVPC